MSERPILFSAPMVRAILSGAKSQTRRVVKPQPSEEGAAAWNLGFGAAPPFRCPYGLPGDPLWVRETTRAGPLPNLLTGEPTNAIVGFYSADDEEVVEQAGFNLAWWYSRPVCPAIHMPRAMSRITLRITDVRVERLNDCSEADAIAEGLYRSKPDDEDRAWYRDHCEDRGEEPDWDHFNAGVWMAPGVPQGWGLTPAERQRDQWAPTAQCAYRLVWEHINGKHSWDANPFVWCVAFQRVQP